jgi:hypothetical protein
MQSRLEQSVGSVDISVLMLYDVAVPETLPGVENHDYASWARGLY